MNALQLNTTVLEVLATQEGILGQSARDRLDSISVSECAATHPVVCIEKSLSRLRSDLRRVLENPRADLEAALRLQTELRERGDQSAEAHFLAAVLYAIATEERRAGHGVPESLKETTTPLALELSLALSLDSVNPAYVRARGWILEALPEQELVRALERVGVYK